MKVSRRLPDPELTAETSNRRFVDPPVGYTLASTPLFCRLCGRLETPIGCGCSSAEIASAGRGRLRA